MRGRLRSSLLTAAALLLLTSALCVWGQQGTEPAPSAAPPPATSGQPSAQLDRIEGHLSPLLIITLIATSLSGLTLLAALGLYWRGPKPATPDEVKPQTAPPPPPAPYDDHQLRGEIGQLRQAVDRMAQQLSLLAPRTQSPNYAPPPPAPAPVPKEESFAGGTPGVPPPDGELTRLTHDYERTRFSRGAWKDFESRYACERFECTNVRERASHPEQPIRFETSPSGVYLAVAADAGKHFVFPFFSASPAQLYHDGAMSEVYDFPPGSPSGPLRVSQPAVFTRTDRQWFLRSRGRLEE